MHRNVNFSADQNSTSLKVQGLISRVRLLKMFPFFEVLFVATKRVCLQNIELKYQKLSLFWKARNRFSTLPTRPYPRVTLSSGTNPYCGNIGEYPPPAIHVQAHKGRLSPLKSGWYILSLLTNDWERSTA